MSLQEFRIPKKIVATKGSCRDHLKTSSAGRQGFRIIYGQIRHLIKQVLNPFNASFWKLFLRHPKRRIQEMNI
jgi:hypothetical protein